MQSEHAAFFASRTNQEFADGFRDNAAVETNPDAAALQIEVARRLERRDEWFADCLDHWFVQGGAAQFGELDCASQNADGLIAAILEAVRRTLKERQTAGDLFLDKVNACLAHHHDCHVDDCETCTTTFQQMSLAHNVWERSRHKGVTACE